MATTTNYGWTTPDDTALVKDGAAAIRTLGTSVDTTTKALNPSTTLGDIEYRSSTPNTNTRLPLGTAGQVLKVNSGATAPEWSSDNAGMTNPMTTTGDTIYSSSGSTPARLGIGTAGQVLKVNSGATAPEWGAPPAAGANWTLLNSGGTTLSGSSTVTVSGISGADKIAIFVRGAGWASSGRQLYLRFNGDTGDNYTYEGIRFDIDSGTFNTTKIVGEGGDGSGQFQLGNQSNNASSVIRASAVLTGANASGVKIIEVSGMGTPAGDTGQDGYVYNGVWNNSATVTSVSLISSSGNFSAGSVFVYTSA
jgi:hypothetical protein